MSILINTLQRSLENKELLAFRTYDDSEKFWCGYVLSLNENLVQIQHISKLGFYDGIVVERIENIESIDVDTYNKAMQFLVGKNQEQYSQQKYELPNNENWQFEFLKINSLQNIFLSIGTNDGSISGYVRDFDEEFLSLQLIGVAGEDNEITIYRLLDANYFQINDLENRKRETLYNWRKMQHLL
ncbi:MAG: hypothetical protein ACXWEY_10905 [Bacteroidia bacterium]